MLVWFAASTVRCGVAVREIHMETSKNMLNYIAIYHLICGNEMENKQK